MKEYPPVKDCPFCGSKAGFSSDGGCKDWAVNCAGCDASMRNFGNDTPEGAAEAWNNRVQQSAFGIGEMVRVKSMERTPQAWFGAGDPIGKEGIIERIDQNGEPSAVVVFGNEHDSWFCLSDLEKVSPKSPFQDPRPTEPPKKKIPRGLLKVKRKERLP